MAMVAMAIRTCIMENYRAPAAYPHLLAVQIDPADLDALERLAFEKDQFKIVHVDKATPDWWTATLACASRRIRDWLQERFD